LTGDVFASTTCDCHEMMAASLEAISREDRGVLVYLHHTGRGFAIEQRSARIGRGGARDLSHARGIRHRPGATASAAARKRHRRANLADLGLTSLRVLTNHPRKVVALEGYGLKIADQVPLAIAPRTRDPSSASSSVRLLCVGVGAPSESSLCEREDFDRR
jgi:3,4-dihydroxy 2-butanone 4-phosphate synthase/GTP cyclohydrolase II